MDLLLTVAKEFGFPIALCAILLLAIRAQNKQLVKSYTDRINALEGLTRALGLKVAVLEEDRIKRTDEFAKVLKEASIRYSTTIRDHNVLTKETLGVLRELADDIAGRPCMNPDGTPKPPHNRYRRTPSSADIPANPAHAETDRLERE